MAKPNGLRKRCLLVVMAKAPVPGQVKTRLIPFIGAQRAAGVYKNLLTHTLQDLSQVKAERILLCAPDTQHVTLWRLARQFGWRCRHQGHGDLGVRMSRIFSWAQRQFDYTVVVGSDITNIHQQIIEQCIAKLNAGNDLVLGATEDGGYGLIAMQRYNAGVFRNIPWSTDRVFHVTLNRARQLKLKTAVINGLWDVDTYRDYRRWIQDYEWHQENDCVV